MQAFHADLLVFVDTGTHATPQSPPPQQLSVRNESRAFIVMKLAA
jgi:hypothetical protein